MALKDKEKRREYHRKYRQANRERIAEYDRRRRKANKEKIAQYDSLRRKANREKDLERKRQYRIAHPEKAAETARRYYRANLDKARVRFSRRRALKLNAPGSHTEVEWKTLCDYYGNKCLACGDVPDLLTRDHVQPLLTGGSDDISNIQPLCLSCNCRKQARFIDYR